MKKNSRKKIISLFSEKPKPPRSIYAEGDTGRKLIIPGSDQPTHQKYFSKKVDHRSGKNESRSLYKDTGRDQGLREPAEAGEELAETIIKGKR